MTRPDATAKNIPGRQKAMKNIKFYAELIYKISLDCEKDLIDMHTDLNPGELAEKGSAVLRLSYEMAEMINEIGPKGTRKNKAAE